MTRRGRAGVVLALLAGIAACGRLETVEFGDPAGAGRRVLIASRGTEFKRAVADRLVAALTAKGVRVRVVDMEALALEEPGDFDLVVLLDRVRAHRLSGDLRAFLARPGGAGEVVVLATAGYLDDAPALEGVDAVTSASDMTRVEATAEALLALMRPHLK
jgi:hypothetical protein